MPDQRKRGDAAALGAEISWRELTPAARPPVRSGARPSRGLSREVRNGVRRRNGREGRDAREVRNGHLRGNGREGREAREVRNGPLRRNGREAAAGKAAQKPAKRALAAGDVGRDVGL